MKEGWLLDAYADGSSAVLWIKHEDGDITRLVDGYRPSFYAQTQDHTPQSVAEMLEEHPDVHTTRIEERFTRLDADSPAPVLRIFVKEIGAYRRVIRDAENLRTVKKVYNVDLLHIQKYLYETGVAPMTKIAFKSGGGDRVVSLNQCGDELSPEPPPFTTGIIHLKGVDRITEIIVEGSTAKNIHGSESDTISEFQGYLEASDPDIIVACDEDLDQIIEASKRHGFELQLSRDGSKCFGNDLRGRIKLTPQAFERYGVAGITERSRFTMAPPTLCAEWPAGKTIDSRQCYEAFRRGFLIPRAEFFQQPTSLYTLIDLDRGGLILSPEVGLHENAAIIDFESMYPHIIVRRNVSYETVQTQRHALGFMVGFTDGPLQRRLHFKHLRNEMAPGSREWLWCEQRQLALKELLVCDYGYSGCFANRFGNVATYQEINRIARDVLVQSMNIAQLRGFQVLYGNSDCLFVKKPHAVSSDYERLAAEISGRVGLPMVLDHHFKFLVLLPQKGLPSLGAANRYYGKLTDGRLFYRGIELRRRDAPELIKLFQRDLMKILFDAGSVEEVFDTQLPRALRLLEETCDKVLEGDVDPESLVFSTRLRKPASEYVSRQPHVIAAELDPEERNTVRYLFVDASNRNPYRRVIPASLMSDNKQRYDREKYATLIREAAKSLLRPLSTTT